MKQSVDELHRALWSLFDAVRARLPISDYRNVVLAVLALKAATDRERYGFEIAREEPSPRKRRKPKPPKHSERASKEGRDRDGLGTIVRPATSSRLLVPGSRGSLEPVARASARSAWDRINDVPYQLQPSELLRIRREVEKSEPSLKGALDALDRHLEEASADLRPIFEILGNIDLDPASFEVPWALGAVVDRLILDLARLDRAKGEYCSSPGVTQLMAALLAITPGLSIHDPAAGTCRLLTECAKYLATTGQDPTSIALSGTEINYSIWSLGHINLWSCGLDASGIQLGPAFAGSHALQFDRVICDPPFGGHVHLDEAEAEVLGLKPGRVRLEDAFVMRAIALLKPGGRAVVLVPQSALFRQDKTTATIRKKLVEERLLRAVVQLPPGLLFGTVVSTSLLVIDRNSKLGGEVRFVDASNAEWEPRTGRLPVHSADAVRMSVGGGRTNLPARTVSVEELAEAEYSLAPNRFLSNELLEPTRSSVLHESSIQHLVDGERSTSATEQLLWAEQTSALEDINIALSNGGVVNLVGKKGTGKTTVLQHLIRRFDDAVIVQIPLGGVQRGFLASLLREKLSAAQSRKGKLVVILDDWEVSGESIADDEIEDIQRLLGGVLERGWGSCIVFASTESLVGLETSGQREIVPRSIVAQTRTITLGTSGTLPKWNALIRKLRNRLAHDKSIDWLEVEAELRHAPLLSDLQERLRVAPRASSDMLRLLDQYLEAPNWERFLTELAEAHPWIRDECRVQGFDLERDRGQLLAFLLRMNIAPIQFLSELLRPSDLARLFPDQDEPRDKATALATAFQHWRQHDERRRNASTRRDGSDEDEDEHVVIRRT